MKKLLIILLVAGVWQCAIAQTSRIDSLKAVFGRSESRRPTPSGIDAMLQISQELRAGDITQAQEYLNLAYNAAKKIKYTQGVVQALQGNGVLQAMRGNWAKAIELTKRAAETANKSGLARYEARSYNNLGIIYQRQGKYQEALHVLLKSVALKETLNDPEELAPTYNNIGVLYKRLANYDNALQYYLKAAKALRNSEDNSLKADVSNNIGNISARLKDWDNAINHNNEALRIYEHEKNIEGIIRAHTNLGIYHTNKGDSAVGRIHYLDAVTAAYTLGEPPALLYAYLNMGRYYRGIAEYDSSRMYYEKAYALSHQLKDMDNILTSLLGLSDVLSVSGQTTRALSLADSALYLAKEIGNNMILPEVYLARMYANRAAGNYDAAFEAYAAYTALRDTLHKHEREREMSSLAVQFGLQLTESENIRLQQEREIQELIMEEQQDRLSDLEREKMLRDLKIESQKAELLLVKEKEAQAASDLVASQKQRALERLKLEQRSFENRLLVLGSLGLVAVLALFIVLYRKKRQSELRAKERSQELQQATGEIVFHKLEVEKKSEELEAAFAAIQDRNALLEELNKEKSEFLAIAAHDLKNPLSTIYGLAELIKSAEPGSAEIVECADHIERSTNRILTLVSNLLDVEMIETGRRAHAQEEVDVRVIARDAIIGNTAAARRKGIVITEELSESNVKVFGDRDSVVQVLDNLLSNAVKFSKLNSEITLRIVESDERVRIEVEDSGPGIAESERANLFKKFSRLSAQPTGGEVSNGLGLYIVAKLVATLNGRVYCESEVGKGSIFIVELPLVPAKTTPTEG